MPVLTPKVALKSIGPRVRLFVDEQPVAVRVRAVQPRLLVKPVGARGAPGIDGGSDIREYSPPTASAEWVFNHNFGQKPTAVQVLIGVEEVDAEVRHITDNQLRVYFASPQSGTVRASL